MPARFLMVLAMATGGGVAVFASGDLATSAIMRPPRTSAFENAAISPAASRTVPVLIDVPAELLVPRSAGKPLRFWREAAIAPAKLCDVIQAGSKTTSWAESPVYPGEWECLSNAPKRGAKAEPFSIFTMARGTDQDHVTYVRFKISAETDTDADKGAGDLARRFEALFAALNWAMPETSFLSIRLLHPFEAEDGGTTIRLVKETLQDGRYNLIVTFPGRTPARAAKDRRTLPRPDNPLQNL